MCLPITSTNRESFQPLPCRVKVVESSSHHSHCSGSEVWVWKTPSTLNERPEVPRRSKLGHRRATWRCSSVKSPRRSLAIVVARPDARACWPGQLRRRRGNYHQGPPGWQNSFFLLVFQGKRFFWVAFWSREVLVLVCSASRGLGHDQCRRSPSDHHQPFAVGSW